MAAHIVKSYIIPMMSKIPRFKENLNGEPNKDDNRGGGNTVMTELVWLSKMRE